jgi:archaellin
MAMQPRVARTALTYSKGLTGPETAIVLAALVALVALVAFTMPWAFSPPEEQSRGFVSGGLVEAKSSLEPSSTVLIHTGAFGATPTDTVYKVSFTVAPAFAGEAVDLTPPYTADDSGIDPDFVSGAEHRTVVSYMDDAQYLPDMPWTVSFIGTDSGDYLLEAGEEAEITVWLLQRDTDVAIDAVDAVMGWAPDGNGVHGILAAGGTVLSPDDRFTIEVRSNTGATLTIQRVVPAELEPVMDLK